MTTDKLSFIHRFVAGSDPARPPLLLLHGTGGNEEDLLGLGAALAPGAALLSPRGQVLEGGMPRFFRRHAEGVFDEADLAARSDDLAAFVTAARAAYGIGRPIAVGFSNGANIAAGMLLTHPDVFAGAVLLRAMSPYAAPRGAGGDGVPVLVLSGGADPIVPADNALRLVRSLTAAGHKVTQETLPAGHGLTRSDLEIASRWLAAQSAG